ncbi:IucA/IucC family protein [Cupriavidus metallidurans]|uniref:IucA/IucC family protein n=1 Tax=Cupriavidus metallidurans TaxID=119219 RepID=UPI00056BF73A|nr:IucA/IucC family protein [Cupriavidus metallidurans]
MSGGFHERLLVQDLIDALWLEDLHGFRNHARIVDHDAGEGASLVIALGRTGELHARGRRLRGIRPLAVQDATLTLRRDGAETTVDGAAALAALQGADWWPHCSERLRALFELARAQSAHTFDHEDAIVEKARAAPDVLMHWEALTCLRDRPFHPLARAKGWGNKARPDTPGYHTETGQPLQLRWVALPRNQVRGSARVPETGQPIAKALLNPHAFERLHTWAETARTDASHLWFPMHPWQRHHLSGMSWIDLGSHGDAWPTASLRSMAVPDSSEPYSLHVKLSLSVQALGATRTLPPRYLHNGVQAQTCLARLQARDAWLDQYLFLCDEQDWWSLRQHDVLTREPGELACLLRRYPAPEQLPPGSWLMPMAACAAVTSGGELPALRALGASDSQQAWDWFRRISHLLLEAGLRCFAHGVMPELHGQNVLLVIAPTESGPGLHGLVLRDHDTLRICPALMADAGVPAPDYAIDRSTPNTLILDAPDALLAYLQTLGICVNLFAMAVAIADAYEADENTGWRIVRERIDALLREGVIARPHVAAIVRNALLEADTWPFKQVLAPLLARETIGTGMPSAMGRLPNPLRQPEP